MSLLCLKPFALLAALCVVAWLLPNFLPRQLRRSARWISLLVAANLCLFTLLPMAMITAVVAGDVVEQAVTDSDVTSMRVDGREPVSYAGETVGLLPYKPGEAPAPLNALHSRGGEWAGRDYVRDCGTPIYASFSGTVRSNSGAGISDSWGNPYIYLIGDDGRTAMLLMHGDYVLSAGEHFEAGQLVGKTNKTGYFLGSAPICHEHISLMVDGVVVDPENYRGESAFPQTAVTPDRPMDTRIADLISGMRKIDPNAAVPGRPGGAPLRVSHYDPSLGGTNCDSDCSTMASGDKVARWVGGVNGVYAAACPGEWPFGTRFKVYGKVYECRDRGGWIRTRSAGEFDPAMGGFTAAEQYHWVDLLDTPPVAYGTLVYEWEFVD